MKTANTRKRSVVIADAAVIRHIEPRTIQDLVEHHLEVRESIGDDVHVSRYELAGAEEICLVLSDDAARHFHSCPPRSVAILLGTVLARAGLRA